MARDAEVLVFDGALPVDSICHRFCHSVEAVALLREFLEARGGHSGQLRSSRSFSGHVLPDLDPTRKVPIRGCSLSYEVQLPKPRTAMRTYEALFASS